MAGGARASPRFTCCLPQIQKLTDRSDVISEVPKCSKIQIFSLPRSPEPLADGKGSLPLTKNPTPAFGPSGLVSTGLRV